MLKVTGTTKDLAKAEEGHEDLYFIELSDVADNPYSVEVSKDAYETINEIQRVLKETAKFAG